jgi:pantoate--beta-alanine ligase
METILTVAQMKKWRRSQRAAGKTIGLVPTMGFLHEGHLSLIRQCRAENKAVVVSIFVNPTQFGPNEDLERYPRDPAGDAAKCRDAGADAIFTPSADAIYPADYHTFVEVERISKPLCGRSRPGHFRGVASVVLKLFNIVRPDKAYFGSKDYQQLQVIRIMARDLNLDVEIVGCETVREADGLAMSSRNAYLSPEQRIQAAVLHGALLRARDLAAAGAGDAAEYIRVMSDTILAAPDAEIDYVALVDHETLEDVNEVHGRALAALAVRVGKTRLIDNMLVERCSDQE